MNIRLAYLLTPQEIDLLTAVAADNGFSDHKKFIKKKIKDLSAIVEYNKIKVNSSDNNIKQQEIINIRREEERDVIDHLKDFHGCTRAKAFYMYVIYPILLSEILKKITP